MTLLKYFKIYPNKKDFLILLKKLFFFYLIILSVLFFFQRKIMYFPLKDTTISSHWTTITKDNKVIALKEKDQNHSYNVLLFHGNAGNADMKNYYKLLFPNANIIVGEYPGFGFRESENLNKDNIIKSSEEIVEEVLKDGKPLVLVGESLGSGVASEMAVKYKIKNLVLATPYNNISSVAQSKFPLLPIYPLVLDRFNNTDVLKNYEGNLVILIAEFDKVIPPYFAYDLSESIKLNKKINQTDILIKGAGHNSYVSSFSNENRETMYKGLKLDINY